MGKKTEIKKGWSIDTIYEIISDLVCFEFILKIKTLIKDVEANAYLSQFLKIIVPVYVYEIPDLWKSLNILNLKTPLALFDWQAEFCL